MKNVYNCSVRRWEVFNCVRLRNWFILLWTQWPYNKSEFNFSPVDGEESIFNPNCRTNILLEDIKRRCNCTKDGKYLRTLRNFNPMYCNYQLQCVNCCVDSRGTIIHIVGCFVLATVDLSDESGNLKYLADHPTTYATEILKARESFVLIRVESKLLPSSFVCSCVKKKFSLSRLHRTFKIVVLKINSQVSNSVC